MSDLKALARRLRGATLVQAVRMAEASARQAGNEVEVGGDSHPREEPIRLVASDRLHLVTRDIAETEAQGNQLVITSNVLGLAGATPALPPVYSELQLRRRRARDPTFSAFLNLFDHRALSFFYRIARKFRWPLLAEGAARGAREPVVGLLNALGGLGSEGVRKRLDVADAALAPLVAHLGDARRTTAGVRTILQMLTGLPLRIIEACPVWISVPPGEQTRLGGALGQFTQLGSGEGEGVEIAQSVMIGASVLDVQHHFIVEIGPVSYAVLQQFCQGSGLRRLVTQLCLLAAGIEQRPSIRVLIAVADIPPLQLGSEAAPALLGWTSWLGRVARPDGIAGDCVIPIDWRAARLKTIVVEEDAGYESNTLDSRMPISICADVGITGPRRGQRE